MVDEKKELNLSDLGSDEETTSRGNVNDGSVKVIKAEDIPAPKNVRPSVSPEESTEPKRMSMRELAASARASQPIVVNGKVTTQAEIDKRNGKNQPNVKTVSPKPIKSPTKTTSQPQQQQEVNEAQIAADTKPMIANLSDLAIEVPMETVEERNMREKQNAIDAAIERVKSDIKENVLPKAQAIADEMVEKKLIEENKKQIAEDGKFNGEDSLSKLTKQEDEDDDEESLLGIPKASVPMQDFKEKTQSLDLSKMNQSIEDDDEMKEIMKELNNDEEDEVPEIGEEKLTPEEEKAQEEWGRQMIEAYKLKIKSTLEASDRIHSVKDGKINISKIPISFSKALQNVQAKSIHTASFPLVHTGRMVTMESLIGDEISILDSRNYESDMEAARAMYGLLYKKDVSPGKPESWDKWLQSICDWDIFNLYMALFIATFKDSCYLPYTCPNCSNMFFKEYKVTDLYRKHPNASKDFDDRVKAIIESGDNSVPSALVSEYLPISKNFAVGFRAPSIYSATFESAALDSKFREKHIQAINVSQYIDGAYYINGVKPNGELDLYPINFKVDKNNATLTLKMKIITIEKMIQTLTTDETAVFTAKLNSLNSKAYDRFQFLIPGTTCHEKYGPQKAQDGTDLEGKECGHKIDEITYHISGGRRVEVNPLDLLFTRHRLTQFAYLEIEL